MGVVDRFEDINGPISILNARTVDDKSESTAKRGAVADVDIACPKGDDCGQGLKARP